MTSSDQRIIDALQGAGIEFDAENFTPSRTFRDNGIDSLDVMSLFLAIEEQYGVKFSELEADAITSPGELAVALESKLS